jgi:hypothetical protein
MHKVFIYVPAFGESVTTATFKGVVALVQALGNKQVATALSTFSFPDIAESRAIATTVWYDTMVDSDYLLFIDADMAFPPELVLDMLLFGEPLVGTLYPQRRVPLSWAGSGTGATTTQRRGNFMEVEGVGMGCTLMRRDVIATLLARMPQIVDERIDLHPAAGLLKQAGAKRLIRAFEKLDFPDRGIISEDLSFCIRWRQCGGQVWAAIGHRMSHVGPYDYAGSYLEHVTEIEKKAQEEAAKQAEQQKADEPELPLAALRVVAGKVEPILGVTGHTVRPVAAE